MAVGNIIKSTDLDSKLSTCGGTLSGALGMGGNKITNLATPTENTDAATKSYIDGKVKSVTISLPSAKWSSSTQSVVCSGILTDETAQEVSICPKVSDFKKYVDAGIYVSSYTTDQLTFTCSETPSSDLTVYIKIQNFR